MPDDGLRRELVKGEIACLELTGSEHGAVTAELNGSLWHHVHEHRLGRVFGAETGFVLQRDPDTVRAPDVAFVRGRRIAEIGVPSTFFPGPPDLAVEVVSPSDRPKDVEAKVDDWLRHGTVEVWVVDPRRRTVVVYQSPGGPREFGEQDVLQSPDLLPGFRLAVAEIFPQAP